MHAVVNHLHFKDPVDPGLFSAVEGELGARMRRLSGFRGARVLYVSDRHVILVIFGDTAQTLDRMATELGNTWMRENVVPLLERPPERHMGEVIAAADAAE